MAFEILLIVLIPLAVWIASSIFKTDDERPGSRPAGAGQRPPVQRRPVTDLERFLEEARRRREMADRRVQQPEPPAPPRPVPPRESRPQVTPERRPARTPPSSQSRRRPVDGPIVRTSRPPVLLEPVPEGPSVVLTPQRLEVPRPEPRRPDPPRPAPVEPVRSMPIPEPTPVLTLLTGLPTIPAATSRSTPPPALAQLVELLRSPSSAGTAIVLREVFDLPLCRRRR
jgi:hypothetical protein